MVVALETRELIDPDMVTKVSEAGGSNMLVCYALTGILGYFVAGCCFYVIQEKFTILEAIYFAVVTFTTVGYGDQPIRSSAGKLFTVGFAMFGVGIISVSIAIIAGVAMSKAAAKKAEEAENSEHEEFKELSEQELAVAAYKAERLLVLTGLVKFALVITGGAVGFSLIEDKSALDGIYWAAVTAATVGYGDITPKTEGPSREYFHWVMMQTSNIMNFASQPLKEPSVVWCDAI